MEDQDYEYVDFATSAGPVMKVNYFIVVEVTVSKLFGLSSRTYDKRLPIKI